MSLLNNLHIEQLRNIASASIDLSPKINLFYGENGSGKTSILEAISLLGLGRSFRSHKSRSLVNHQYSELTVFSHIAHEGSLMPVGVQKSKSGSSMIRMAGDTVKSASLLAKHLPLLVVNASSFQLIEGSPVQRRQFLDWMVFHVKPEFSSLWKDLQKILKQRNSLLRRDKISYSDIEPWDVTFCHLAEAIDQARREVFEAFVSRFVDLESQFLGQALGIEMEYVRGWNHEQCFNNVLQSAFERDARDGYTHYGPQRAEIKIRAQQKMASDVLSRGQEKSLICAMTVTQAQLYKDFMGKDCVFLVDDLLAELDIHNSQKLAHWLSQLQGQVFVTGVVKEALEAAWQNELTDIAVFHVKHGNITKENTQESIQEKK